MSLSSVRRRSALAKCTNFAMENKVLWRTEELVLTPYTCTEQVIRQGVFDIQVFDTISVE
eukprot:1196282-Prorocentrum_minimum.AAC.11